ncbi:MAG TPA: hypothetical protein PKC93_08500 [Candidatus Obscuribacter sp.]|nr:hypothetical protein [Candidatus Obscuribacter sp.]
MGSNLFENLESSHGTDNQNGQSFKLQQEAYMAMAVVGTAALLYASKGQNPKALAYVAGAADDIGMAISKRAGSFVDDFALSSFKPANFFARNDSAGALAQVGRQLDDNAAKPLTSMFKRADGEVAGAFDMAKVTQGTEAIKHNYSVGAVPGLNYAQSIKELHPSQLGFLQRWVVQGVKMTDDSVDLYLNKQGRDIALQHFSRPPGIKPLDVLNTEVSSIKLTQGQTLAGQGSETTTRLWLEMGGRKPIKLTGNIKALDFVPGR